MVAPEPVLSGRAVRRLRTGRSRIGRWIARARRVSSSPPSPCVAHRRTLVAASSWPSSSPVGVGRGRRRPRSAGRPSTGRAARARPTPRDGDRRARPSRRLVRPYVSCTCVRRGDDDHQVRREPVRTLRAADLPVREVRLLHLDRLADLGDVERDLVDGRLHVRDLAGVDRTRLRVREVGGLDALPVLRARLRVRGAELVAVHPPRRGRALPAVLHLGSALDVPVVRRRPSTSSTSAAVGSVGEHDRLAGPCRRRDRCSRPRRPSSRSAPCRAAGPRRSAGSAGCPSPA